MVGFGPESGNDKNCASPPACPCCGNREAYRLADGRRQCQSCRKKYTNNPSHSRLSTLSQLALAQHFWQMTPAENTAKVLKLNRKTVQKHYTGLRLILAQDAQTQFTQDLMPLVEADATALVGDGQPFCSLPNNQLPVFWVTHYQGRYHVLFPSPGLGNLIRILQQQLTSVMVIAFNRDDRDRLLIDRFQQTSLPLGKTAPNAPVLANFWSDTRMALRKYRGGFKQNFPLFIQEMAYRLSYPEQKTPPCLLMQTSSA